MIAFEISYNGQVLAVVGARESVGIHATLMACGDLDSSDGVPLVYLMGLANTNGPSEGAAIHHTWVIKPPEGQFAVGDTLSIRIIRTESPTPATEIQETENEASASIAAPNADPAQRLGDSGAGDGSTK